LLLLLRRWRLHTDSRRHLPLCARLAAAVGEVIKRCHGGRRLEGVAAIFHACLKAGWIEVGDLAV
jgi:hypothetical protein